MIGWRLYPWEGNMDITRLKEKLEGNTDPRRQWGNLRYKLEDIFVIGLGGAVV
jgi:hypothetical protein